MYIINQIFTRNSRLFAHWGVRGAGHQDGSGQPMSGELMAGSFTGISTRRIETQWNGCPLIRSCIHYQILWLSRFASMQRGLDLSASRQALERLVPKLGKSPRTMQECEAILASGKPVKKALLTIRRYKCLLAAAAAAA